MKPSQQQGEGGWRRACAAWAALWVLTACTAAQAATPAEVLEAYVKQAKAPAVPERGQKFFTTNFGRDMGFSCASCHGESPVKAGRDQVTEKFIRPLAPAANAARLSDKVKVEFWFKQNCRDVVGRECTAGEKADMISWLISLNP